LKQSVQFPLHTVSENAYRSMHPLQSHRISASQRAFVAQVIGSQLERVRGAEQVRVTLVRICCGVLDDDNLRGALKAVRDEVAAWLGIDDGDVPRLRFEYDQQVCKRGYRAVRVEVDDGRAEDPREICKVVGAAPPVLRPIPHERARGGARGSAGAGLGPDARARGDRGGAPSAARDGRDRGADRPRAPADQARIQFMKSYALLPWEQREGAAPRATLLRIVDDDPPPTIRVPAPPGWTVRELSIQGRTVRVSIDGGALVLYRHRYRHARLGDCWMFMAVPHVSGSAAQQGTQHKQGAGSR
jgi:hypothetical protein